MGQRRGDSYRAPYATETAPSWSIAIPGRIVVSVLAGSVSICSPPDGVSSDAYRCMRTLDVSAPP